MIKNNYVKPDIAQKGKQNEKVYKNHDRIHEPHGSGSCERICGTQENLNRVCAERLSIEEIF